MKIDPTSRHVLSQLGAVLALGAALAWPALPARGRESPGAAGVATDAGCAIRDDMLIHGLRHSHEVALTFDACPTRLVPGFAAEIVEYLAKEGVPATFFVSGRWAES